MKSMKIKIVKIILILPLLSYSSSPDSSFYPLSLGNSWDYFSDFDPHSEILADTLTVNENLYYGIKRSMSAPEFWLRESDNKIFFLNSSGNSEFLVFDFSLEVNDSILIPAGYECSFGSKIFLRSKTDTVIANVDTFYNCYHFKHQPNCADAGLMDTWFCQGIGKVKFREVFIHGEHEFLLSSYIITNTDLNNKNGIDFSMHLLQNYPNPFNPLTAIEFIVPKTEFVTLKIFNLLGQEIETLVSKQLNAGSYIYEWDATDFSAGIYIYSFEAGNYREVKKMVLLK